MMLLHELRKDLEDVSDQLSVIADRLIQEVEVYWNEGEVARIDEVYEQILHIGYVQSALGQVDQLIEEADVQEKNSREWDEEE